MNNIIKDKSYEVFTTGLSYSINGIDNKFLRKKSSKLTLPSQDLYYDFLIAKRVLETNENIKYSIMGLAYFSFNSDLSLQSEACKVEKVYYPIFKDAHNYKISSNYFEPLKLKNLENYFQMDNYIFNENFMQICTEKFAEIDILHGFDEVCWKCDNKDIDFQVIPTIVKRT